MDMKYFFKKLVLPLVITLFTILTFQITALAYSDNTNYTPEEVRQINKETIAREQAERLRNKQRLLLEHQKHSAHNQGQQTYVQPAQWQQKQWQRPYKAHRVSGSRSAPAWRRSAGHTATRGADDAILTAAKSRNLALVKQLVAEGVDIRHKNFSGESALHIAASLGNIQMVQYLINQGENVNTKTIKNWLPIHHAIRFNHPVVANYLISHRASLGFKNSDGFSALDFATRSKNMRIKAISRRHRR